MKTSTLFLCLFVPLFAFSQYSPVDEFYDVHKHRDHSISLNIGNFLLTAGSWFVEEPGVKNLVRKSRNAKILLSESDDFVTETEIKRLVKDMKSDDFESLAYMRTEGTKFQIYAREDRGFIRNIVLLINEPDDFVMVSLDCKFHMDDVQDLLNEL